MSALLCNGLASNCDLRVNEMMFPGVHNAMSSREDSFVGPNNLKRLEDALHAGFRFIDLESCDCDDPPGLHLCHTTCQFEGLGLPLGNRDVGEVFTNIKGFLDNNLSEVVIVSLQVNDDTLGAVHSVISGIDELLGILYSHPDPDEEWPTMRELITSGKRLMIMHHNEPTCTEPCYEGLIKMYNHVFDTPWDLDQEGLLDYDQSCVMLRGTQGSKAFFLSNHFAGTGGSLVSLPSLIIARAVNERSVLDDRHKECEARLGKRPNFIMVDFWSVGDMLAFVEESNRALGPTDAPITMGPTPGPSAGPTVEPTENPIVPPTGISSLNPTTNNTASAPDPTQAPTAIPTSPCTALEGSGAASCGPNRTCDDGSCCSQFGYCGNGTLFCGECCQSGCTTSAPTPAPAETDAPTSSPSAPPSALSSPPPSVMSSAPPSETRSEGPTSSPSYTEVASNTPSSVRTHAPGSEASTTGMPTATPTRLPTVDGPDNTPAGIMSSRGSFSSLSAVAAGALFAAGVANFIVAPFWL